MSDASRLSGIAVPPMPDLRDSFPGPFPVGPHGDHAELELLDWLGRFPLVTSPSARRVLCHITGHGVSRTLPDADRESLVLCAQLFLWLTAFDDAHGEAGAARDPAALVRRVAGLVPLLSGDTLPAPTGEPFGDALRDVLARFGERATPDAYLRLTGRVRDNLFGMVWEAHHWEDPGQVGLDEYRAMRPCTVFVRTITAAAEIVLPLRLTDEERSSAAVTELEAAVAQLAGWINDLASHAREAERSESPPLTLPTLLAAHHGLDPAGAFRAAAALCEEQAAVARTLITELTGRGPGPLADHARVMETVANSFVWHIDHARYRG